MSGTVREARLSVGEILLRGLAWCIVHTVQRPKLSGVKPALDEPTIFVCSHVGLMDPVVLMILYHRYMIRPLVAKDYYDKSRFTQFFYTHAQCIPIDRRHVATRWLEDSLVALAKGEHIIIYPEGKRNKTGKGLLPFHSGAALLAAKSGARIIPVYNSMWHFPHRYRLAIGEPFSLEEAPSGDLSAWLKEQTRLIQDRVAALIPAE